MIPALEMDYFRCPLAGFNASPCLMQDSTILTYNASGASIYLEIGFQFTSVLMTYFLLLIPQV